MLVGVRGIEAIVIVRTCTQAAVGSLPHLQPHCMCMAFYAILLRRNYYLRTPLISLDQISQDMMKTVDK